VRALGQDMPRQLRGGRARRHARLGLLAGRVDLDVDVERGGDGGLGLPEQSAAGVQLGGFLDGVDRRDAEEVGQMGGEGFAFIWKGLVMLDHDLYLYISGDLVGMLVLGTTKITC
jgi:hypothetical protein